MVLFEDNTGNLICRYIFVQADSHSVNLNINDEVITNDNNIAKQVNASDNPITITVTPVSKVLERPGFYTIFTNVSCSNTIIYSEMPILIGSEGPENTNEAVLNSKIMIITNTVVTVKNNIIYSDFSSIQDFINRCETKDVRLRSDRNGLLRVISNEIIFDTSDYRISDSNANRQCLSGQFVSMYDNNSVLRITNPTNISSLYVFGGVQASNRIGFNQNNFRELYITDGRLVAIDPSLSLILDNMDNSIYLNEVSVLGIEILSR